MLTLHGLIINTCVARNGATALIPVNILMEPRMILHLHNPSSAKTSTRYLGLGRPEISGRTASIPRNGKEKPATSPRVSGSGSPKTRNGNKFICSGLFSVPEPN